MAKTLEPELQALVDLWQDIRPAEWRIPERAAFDPMRLRRLVANVHLLEFDGPGRLIYRLSGTAEEQRLGEDPKGKDYFDLVDPAASAYLRANMHAIAFHPACVLVTTRETYADGSATPTRFIGLPLRDSEAGRDYVISIVAVSGRKDLARNPPSEPGERPWHDEIVSIEAHDLGFGMPGVPAYPPGGSASSG